MVSCGSGAINKDKPKFSKAFPRPKTTSTKRKERMKKIVAKTSVAARGLSKKKQRLLNKRKGAQLEAMAED